MFRNNEVVWVIRVDGRRSGDKLFQFVVSGPWLQVGRAKALCITWLGDLADMCQWCFAGTRQLGGCDDTIQGDGYKWVFLKG